MAWNPGYYSAQPTMNQYAVPNYNGQPSAYMPQYNGFNGNTQQPMQQAQPQQQPQMQTPPVIDNFPWIRVNGMADVKDITVMPNRKAWIMVQNQPVFCVKEANNLGVCNTEYFRFEQIKPEEPSAPAPEVKAEQYVSVSDFNLAQEKITELENKIQVLTERLERAQAQPPAKQPPSRQQPKSHD